MSEKRRVLVLSSVIAMALVAVSYYLPLWKMRLDAPQYPASLRLEAYGTRIEGDLREINIINHYVGMRAIDTVPAPEMGLFGYAVVGLVAACALAALHRRLRQLAILAILVTAIVIIGDLQLWLRDFGQNLKPAAPIRVEPFTPLAIGVSKIGNFKSTAMVSWGYLSLLAGALVLFLGGRVARKKEDAEAAQRRSNAGKATAASAAFLLVLVSSLPVAETSHGTPASASLQSLIDRASRGTTLRVEGGIHSGPVHIQGPLTVVGVGRPVIDGGGSGSVVRIEGEGVVFRGFHVRNSGRHVSEEAAGVKVEGSGHLIEDNHIEDVYFGVHLSNGARNVVRGNRIVPGKSHGERPGHAISLWYQQNGRVLANVIAEARDGVYLSFADDVLVENNEVESSRYGVHSMYSKRSTFNGNRLSRNLLGTALMYSSELVMRCNVIQDHREGATAYGILLKDIDELRLEGNVLARNRVGIYADNIPLGAGRRAVLSGNVFSGNETALALQSTTALTFVGNRVEHGLSAVRSEGASLSANRWDDGGRGNYWDDYRGYDRDGDGIGDLPYQYRPVMDEIVRRNPRARAFAYTPAHLALESAARLFPVYRAEPLVVDEHPLMSPPAPESSCGVGLP